MQAFGTLNKQLLICSILQMIFLAQIRLAVESFAPISVANTYKNFELNWNTYIQRNTR